MRHPIALATTLLAATVLVAAAAAQKHPYFDDQGTLAWSTTFAAAKEAAKKADKLILVEVGAKT